MSERLSLLCGQGNIPVGISNLVNLKELNVSYNFGVIGALPRDIGNMSSLTVLHIYSTSVGGELAYQKAMGRDLAGSSTATKSSLGGMGNTGDDSYLAVLGRIGVS